MSSLIGSYCIINGLQSAAGKRSNGKECFVLKPDDDNNARLAVFPLDSIGRSGSALISIKPENLQPRFNVESRPSSTGVVGKGLFATRGFKKGEMIMEEDPLLVAPTEAKAADVSRLASRLPAHERAALETLRSEAPAEMIEALKKSHGVADEAALAWLLRVQLNGTSSASAGKTWLYPLISRIQHKCSVLPEHNVWSCPGDDGSGLRIVTASRDIEAGEELFCDYLETTFDPKKRNELLGLKQFGLAPCGCTLCDVKSPATVALFKEYNAALDAIRSFKGAGGLNALQEQSNRATIATKGVIDAVSAKGAASGSDEEKNKKKERTDVISCNMFTPITTAKMNACVAVMMSGSVSGKKNSKELLKIIEQTLLYRFTAFKEYCGNNEEHPFFDHEKKAYESNLGKFQMMMSMMM